MTARVFKSSQCASPSRTQKSYEYNRCIVSQRSDDSSMDEICPVRPVHKTELIRERMKTYSSFIMSGSDEEESEKQTEENLTDKAKDSVEKVEDIAEEETCNADVEENNESMDMSLQKGFILIMGILLQMESYLGKKKNRVSATVLKHQITVVKSLLLGNSDMFEYNLEKDIAVKPENNGVRRLRKRIEKRNIKKATKENKPKTKVVMNEDNSQTNLLETFVEQNQRDEVIYVKPETKVDGKKLRRSKRPHIKPLKHWTGEKLVENLDGSFAVQAASKSCLTPMFVVVDKSSSSKRGIKRKRENAEEKKNVKKHSSVFSGKQQTVKDEDKNKSKRTSGGKRSLYSADDYLHSLNSIEPHSSKKLSTTT